MAGLTRPGWTNVSAPSADVDDFEAALKIYKNFLDHQEILADKKAKANAFEAVASGDPEAIEKLGMRARSAMPDVLKEYAEANKNRSLGTLYGVRAGLAPEEAAAQNFLNMQRGNYLGAQTADQEFETSFKRDTRPNALRRDIAATETAEAEATQDKVKAKWAPAAAWMDFRKKQNDIYTSGLTARAQLRNSLTNAGNLSERIRENNTEEANQQRDERVTRLSATYDSSLVNAGPEAMSEVMTAIENLEDPQQQQLALEAISRTEWWSRVGKQGEAAAQVRGQAQGRRDNERATLGVTPPGAGGAATRGPVPPANPFAPAPGVATAPPVNAGGANNTLINANSIEVAPGTYRVEGIRPGNLDTFNLEFGYRPKFGIDPETGGTLVVTKESPLWRDTPSKEEIKNRAQFGEFGVLMRVDDLTVPDTPKLFGVQVPAGRGVPLYRNFIDMAFGEKTIPGAADKPFSALPERAKKFINVLEDLYKVLARDEDIAFMVRTALESHESYGKDYSEMNKEKKDKMMDDVLENLRIQKNSLLRGQMGMTPVERLQ